MPPRKAPGRRKPISWENDRSTDTGKCSTDVVIEWLTKGDNYNRWVNARSLGEKRENMCAEVYALLNQNGIGYRTNVDIYVRINKLEKDYVTAQALLDGAAHMNDDESKARIHARAAKICKHYDGIAPIFQRVASSASMTRTSAGAMALASPQTAAKAKMTLSLPPTSPGCELIEVQDDSDDVDSHPENEQADRTSSGSTSDPEPVIKKRKRRGRPPVTEKIRRSPRDNPSTIAAAAAREAEQQQQQQSRDTPVTSVTDVVTASSAEKMPPPEIMELLKTKLEGEIRDNEVQRERQQVLFDLQEEALRLDIAAKKIRLTAERVTARKSLRDAGYLTAVIDSIVPE